MTFYIDSSLGRGIETFLNLIEDDKSKFIEHDGVQNLIEDYE